jgi:RHS repeat-associated protein
MKNSPGVLEGNYVLGSLRQAAGRTGLRGIDWMWKKVSSGTPVVAFPIYDGHGNMVYTLSRGGNETFSLGNKRIYGAWGDLRYDGNPGDGPNTQYCANLGHKLDNESGLTYMRARYYEPWTGRFLSEDIAKDGRNWFIYASNNPIGFVDFTGKHPIAALLLLLGALGGLKTLVYMNPALDLFTVGLSAAIDSLQVEELWDEYMDAYRGSSLLGEEGSLLARLAGMALQFYNLAMGRVGTPWGTLVGGVAIGVRGGYLCYGYQLRIAWYIADIDKL